jgi:uncharacterized protein (TIGR02996 family)
VADIMAIISKAIVGNAVGTKLLMDRYVSTNKALDGVSDGGKLYLVTVRPPAKASASDEALWLVAILEKPKHDGAQWIAKASQIPITDISKLRAKIKFESGVGITAKKGALGMSLQTPRPLTAADTALLDKAAGLASGSPETSPGDDKGLPAPPSAPSPIGAATGERRGTLLDAILENPDSDEARQVYADQLMGNNDPRGEFIQLEIQLAGPLSIRKREQLRVRRGILLKEHGGKWWPYSLAHSRVHKGFLDAAHGSWKQIKAIATKLFESEPITELGLTDVGEKDLEAFLKSPWLPRIRRLVMRHLEGDEGFTTLATSPALANLRALNVTASELSADALAELALPRLENLVLTGNPIGDEGVENLAQWKQLANVETLYLSACEISEEGIDQLFSGAPLAKLKKLTLSNNELGDEGAGVIVKAAARMPALEHLELLRCGLSQSGVKALAKAKLPTLRRLDVRFNEVDDGGDPRIRA